MAKLPADAGEKRLAKAHPTQFLRSVREKIASKAEGVLDRLFELATATDVDPRVNLEAIKIIAELSNKAMDLPGDVDESKIIEGELSESDEARYARIARESPPTN